MITIINHNTRTSALMSELAFAHEVGHNLGAEVDWFEMIFCFDSRSKHFYFSMIMKNVKAILHMVIL